MSQRSVINAEHAEIHISMCDLALDVTPEGGGFNYQVTDLGKNCLIPMIGGQYVSHEIAKHQAEDDPRKYAGGYPGPIEWTPVRFSDGQ
jgi:hypothetical protein